MVGFDEGAGGEYLEYRLYSKPVLPCCVCPVTGDSFGLQVSAPLFKAAVFSDTAW